MKREPKKIRGVFEREPGSGIWWIRYADASRIRREKVGNKAAAIQLYNKRKTRTVTKDQTAGELQDKASRNASIDCGCFGALPEQQPGLSAR